jgi:hypothetical protein
MQNNAEVKDATENGPMGPEQSLDGTIEVELNADICASGKTKGTGSAVINGSVVAQGSHAPDNTSGVVNTSITSSVVLNSGPKGSAEGKVNSSGSASATYNGTQLTSNVSGATSASGKTQSGSVGMLESTGKISSESMFLPDSNSATAMIFSNLIGSNTASGKASASGDASASADSGNLTAGVVGSTKAEGSGKGLGDFQSVGEISSESEESLGWGYVETSIESYSSVESGGAKYSATASSSASTPMGQQNYAYYGGDTLDLNEYSATTTGDTSSSAKICDGKGLAGSESGIEAFAAVPGMGMYELGFGPEFAYLGFEFEPVEYVDGSLIWSDAWTTGYDSKAELAADSSAGGEARAKLYYNNTGVGVYTSNTTAYGDTSAGVEVEGQGDASADSQIASYDLLGVGGGYFGIYGGLPYEQELQLPAIQDAPALPSDLLLTGLPELPVNGAGSFPAGTDLLGPLQAPIGFDLPPMNVLEISIISQSVSATNQDEGEAFAEACAHGETGADGTYLQTLLEEESRGYSYAYGTVAGEAEVDPEEDGQDPASASAIVGVSAQGIGDNGDVSGLDATLLASVSGAGGLGETCGMASGEATASGMSTIGLDGPSSSKGMVETSAEAEGGLGLSAAAIGSADYETFIPDVGGSLIDVALIGTGSFGIGTAGAEAFANGSTTANGEIFQEINGTTLFNATSSAFAEGEACSEIETENGVALAADLILAGEGTDTAATGPIGAGGSIAGSMVGQAVFARKFDSKGSAEAETRAEGQANTFSSFYDYLGEGAGGDPMYITGDGSTLVGGVVKGGAESCSGDDPLSASAIVSFTEFGGNAYISDGTLLAGSGDVYDATLIASLSASAGTSGSTWGLANGSAGADSHLEINTTPEDDSLFVLDSISSADAMTKSTASTSGNNGFALGLAAQGSSSDVEAILTGSGGTVDQHAITLDGALSTAAGDGKATSYVNMEEQKIKNKKGKVIGTTMVPIEGREAIARASFTADTTDDGVPDVVITSDSVSGSSAMSAAEAAKGGFALSLAGEASGAMSYLSATDDIPADADQDTFAVLAALAVAETDNKKETAKASASANGMTDAISYEELANWNSTQSSVASGNVSAWGTGGDVCKDPLSLSLILSLGESRAEPDPNNSAVAMMDTKSRTLIAALSLTNGSKGDTGAEACGEAFADGVQMQADYFGVPVSPSSSAVTEASVKTHAAGTNGFGMGVSGVGSNSEAHVDVNLDSVKDENLMFSYATAQGFGKKAAADACASYDAVGTAMAASNIYDPAPDNASVASTSSVSGKGESLAKAADMSKAQALSFGWAEQNAYLDFFTAFDMGDPANASHADAMVLFGTEANASDNAKNTLAKADACQVNLAADARAGPYDAFGISIPEETALAGVNNGHSYVCLDPDGGPAKNGFLDLDTTVSSYDADVNTIYGSFTYGRFITGSTMTNPNYGYTHGGAWANSDVSPPPDPFPYEDYIIPLLPV